MAEEVRYTLAGEGGGLSPTVSEQKGRRQHSLATGSQTKPVSSSSIHTSDMWEY